MLPLFAGAGAAALAPEEAEGSPAVKGFAEMYDKAVRDGSRKMMYAGTLDPDVFEQAARREPSLRNNKVFAGPHGGQARIATGEMTPLEVGRHIENMLNSADTQVLPNFPSSNYRNNAKNMLFLNDGKPVVSPYMGGYDGDIILKTVFQPDNDKRKFIEDYLGRPPSPISGLRNDVSASAQPPGLSAVRQLSSERTIPQGGVPGKKHITGMAGAAALIPHEGEPAQRAEGKTKAPAAWNEFRRGLGVGTRNLLTGLGRGGNAWHGRPRRGGFRLDGAAGSEGQP